MQEIIAGIDFDENGQYWLNDGVLGRRHIVGLFADRVSTFVRVAGEPGSTGRVPVRRVTIPAASYAELVCHAFERQLIEGRDACGSTSTIYLSPAGRPVASPQVWELSADGESWVEYDILHLIEQLEVDFYDVGAALAELEQGAEIRGNSLYYRVRQLS